MTRALAVFSKTLQRLVNEPDIFLIDVEPKQTQSTSGAATYAVEELQSLAHQVVVILVVLVAQVVLKIRFQHWVHFCLPDIQECPMT